MRKGALCTPDEPNKQLSNNDLFDVAIHMTWQPHVKGLPRFKLLP